MNAPIVLILLYAALTANAAMAIDSMGFHKHEGMSPSVADLDISELHIATDSLGATSVDVKSLRHATTIGPDSALLFRGSASVNVYKNAAPSVVVVVSDDGIGSGALISSDGDIVTNLHVVGNSRTVGVIFKSESESQASAPSSRNARVIKIDRKTDLAIIRVNSFPRGVSPLRLSGVSDVAVGSDVHAIGHPTGNTWTYTRGYVSAIRRGFSWNKQHEADVIQTQTPINPGNSGGPLLNDEGAIVGINSFKDSSSEGLNFAVAGDHVRSLILGQGDQLEQFDAKSKTCEESPRLRKKSRDEDRKTNVYLYDINCDQKDLFEIRVPDDKKTPVAWLFDRNRDGSIDVAIFDKEHDKKFDFSFHDVDFDGRWDLIGYHPDGKIKASRFVKYEE